MAGKYQPLEERLAELAVAGQRSAEFDFDDVAQLVGWLPPSAYEHRPWWGNGNHVQAQAWLNAGWHVDQVDLERQRVRFTRGPSRRSETSAPVRR